MKPGKHQRKKKDVKIYVGRSTTVRNLLFCVHTPCISYEIKTFLLLVPRSMVNNDCVPCTVKARTKT